MKQKAKKSLTIALILISAFSAGISVYAISIPDISVRENVEEVSAITGSLSTRGILSEGSIYGSESSLDYYPGSITERIEGSYTISTNPETSGMYLLSITSTYYIKDGKNTITLWEETISEEKGGFNGEKVLEFSIIPSRLNTDLERVKEGTGVSRVQQIVRINIEAKTDLSEFEHTITLNKKSGLYSFTNPEKTVKETEKTRVEKKNYLTGMEIKNARAIYGLLSVSAIIPAIVINRGYLSNIGKGNAERGAIIVNGSRQGDKVLVESFDDLKKIFQLSDAPVIKTRDGERNRYTIESGGVTYEYRD